MFTLSATWRSPSGPFAQRVSLPFPALLFLLPRATRRIKTLIARFHPAGGYDPVDAQSGPSLRPTYRRSAAVTS